MLYAGAQVEDMSVAVAGLTWAFKEAIDRHTVLRWAPRQSGMLAVVDIFVKAGWPSAQRLS